VAAAPHAPRRWPSRNPPVRRPPVCAYQELGSAKLPQTESAPNITQLTCLLSSSLESSFRPAIPLFGVPVRWSASDNEIILSDALLELPVHTDNTGLYPHLLHNVDTHRTYQELSTTNDQKSGTQHFRVTHPFHPLLGREFELVICRTAWGEQRVYFHDDHGRLRALPVAWTDVQQPDPFVVLAAGSACFRPEDLLRLCTLCEQKKRESNR